MRNKPKLVSAEHIGARIDKTSKQPAHRQVANAVMELLADGKISLWDVLPTAHDLECGAGLTKYMAAKCAHELFSRGLALKARDGELLVSAPPGYVYPQGKEPRHIDPQKIADHIDRTSDVPLYMQVSSLLESWIEDGIVKAGDVIPSVRDLSLLSGMAPVTIMRGYHMMAARGLTGIKGRNTILLPLDGSLISQTRRAQAAKAKSRRMSDAAV